MSGIEALRYHDRGMCMERESSTSALGGAWGDGPTDRRDFLKLAAKAGVAIGLVGSLPGCVIAAAGQKKLHFGDDFGVLNYAYALETLESKFYERVVAQPPSDLRAGELQILSDIRNHEVQHRRFFKRALQVLRAEIPPMNFDSIDFNTRQGVLTQAKAFEDLGVAAYNGAGERLKLAEFLTIAGKIVSVEARHAAALRDMLEPNTRAFAGDDVVDANGLDKAMSPGDVLEVAQRYFRTPFRIAGL